MARGGVARRTLRPVSDTLPTGTVTFLFTDVEGSTRLDELGRHRNVVRDASRPLAATPRFQPHSRPLVSVPIATATPGWD
jgi:hypothetical protein